MKKRVVIYGINYAPEIAGVGKYTGEIGEYLASQGHDVCVITAPPHYPGWAPKDGHSAKRWSKSRIHGSDIYRCPLYLHPEMRGIRRLIAPLTFALSSAPVAFYQILKRRPDVVIAIEPTLFVAPIALAASWIAGSKRVLHVQDLEIDAAFAMGHLRFKSLAKIATAFERGVMNRFDRIVTISARMAEKIYDKGVDPKKLEIVRNWVDLDAVKPMPSPLGYREELGLKASDFVVLYSGNLGPKQGIGLLIEAARQLANEPDVVFAIAGQGPMRAEIERATQVLPNVRLYDFQPKERFGEFLNVADVHALPQERHAADLLLPSKLGGMLASGRPIIVTAEPGTELASFVTTSCALTKPGDARALADAVRALRSGETSPTNLAHRLRLASSLAKPRLIDIFTRVALFLNPEAPTPVPAHEAAQNGAVHA